MEDKTLFSIKTFFLTWNAEMCICIYSPQASNNDLIVIEEIQSFSILIL